MPETGLRDRKKQRTRDALIDVAHDLFEKQGYEGTTVEQIAAGAEVAPRTFFRYFTSKEDLLQLGQADENARMEQLLRERPAGEAPLDTIVRGVTMFLEWDAKAIAQARRSRRLILRTPSLRKREHELLSEAQDILARGLTPKHASKGEALRIRVMCAAFLAALGTAMNAWLDGESKGAPASQLRWVADQVRSGFDAAREGRAGTGS